MLLALSGANKHLSTFVDNEDIAYLILHKWYINRGGYVWAGIYNPLVKQSETFRLHRMIMEARLGRRLDPSEIVDHIDRNKLNNSFSNLRLVDKSVNAINSNLRKDNKYGYRGVSYIWCYKNGKKYKRSKPWLTQITCKTYGKYTKYHLTLMEAALDYDRQAVQWFGASAMLNIK